MPRETSDSKNERALTVREQGEPKVQKDPKRSPSPLKRLAAALKKPKPMYRRWWLIVLLLLLVPPVGIVLLWTQKRAWPLWLKLPLTVLSAAVLVWAVIQSASVTI